MFFDHLVTRHYDIRLHLDTTDRPDLQGTSIFSVTVFQYMTLAVVYSKGFPYRKPLFNNRLLCGSLTVLATISIVSKFENF